jgi:hypothetical protein
MLPDATLPLPGSLTSELACFASLFTAPSFRTLTTLACGFLAQTGKRTVCGLLAGAGLSRVWPVTVMLIRDRSASGYDLALVTTDAGASAAAVIERCARWSIEVAIEDSKQIFGAGQARNRLAHAVERTVPFQLACQAITTCWYGTAGHDPADAADHRARAPWYTTKSQPSTADMAGKLRRVVIAAKFPVSRPDQPTRQEINVIRLAWEDLAA